MPKSKRKTKAKSRDSDDGDAEIECEEDFCKIDQFSDPPESKEKKSKSKKTKKANETGELPGGVVHELPDDLCKALTANSTAKAAWSDITELARNEFCCWVLEAKQAQTRARRVRRTVEELEEGKRRPCCWPGCKHRERGSKKKESESAAKQGKKRSRKSEPAKKPSRKRARVADADE